LQKSPSEFYCKNRPALGDSPPDPKWPLAAGGSALRPTLTPYWESWLHHRHYRHDRTVYISGDA